MNLCTTSEAGQNNSTLPVSNTDILKTAALNYKKLINKEYRFTVGDKNTKTEEQLYINKNYEKQIATLNGKQQ